MASPRVFSILFSAALIASVCGPMAAQQSTEDSNWLWNKILHPRHVEQPVPFGADEKHGSASQIEFRSAAQMTQADIDLASSRQAAIREKASLAGFDVNEGRWDREQIECPAFPNHELLRYAQNGGPGGESVFTASISRTSHEQVRVVPILRRGYSLYSPAPMNALTITVFNHIREEEHAPATADWLEIGMCYAALAGAHARVPLAGVDTGSEIMPFEAPAILQIPAEGGAVIRFLDASTVPIPMVWTMTFDGAGKVVSADHHPALEARPRVLSPTVEQPEPKGKPLPTTVVDLPAEPRQ
jgi:hypothetical protein